MPMNLMSSARDGSAEDRTQLRASSSDRCRVQRHAGRYDEARVLAAARHKRQREQCHRCSKKDFLCVYSTHMCRVLIMIKCFFSKVGLQLARCQIDGSQKLLKLWDVIRNSYRWYIAVFRNAYEWNRNVRMAMLTSSSNSVCLLLWLCPPTKGK
jgi:hypothetical protein